MELTKAGQMEEAIKAQEAADLLAAQLKNPTTPPPADSPELARWKQKALDDFPALKERNSELNRKLKNLREIKEQSAPDFFKNPQWPYLLAEEASIGNPPGQPAGKTPQQPTTVTSSKEGYTNSLGMKFIPVKGTDVLFCIHETRRQDFMAFAAETPTSNLWKDPKRDGVPAGQGLNHPVVNVTWNDAQQFCKWLSKKEGKVYRLPTDREWSTAMGIAAQERWGKNITPSMRSGKLPDNYPWGNKYPPQSRDRVGNYGDISYKNAFPLESCIEGYNDGFSTTAPVMSFKPNNLGIYDLGGNVWEWCEDLYEEGKITRTWRGGSWAFRGLIYTLSDFRDRAEPTFWFNDVGFRCVLEKP